MVFYQGGLSTGWSFIRLVFHQGSLSIGWSFIRLVFQQGGLLSGWSFIWVVIYQAGFSTGWSFIRLVFQQGGLLLVLTGWSLIRVVFHQDCQSSGVSLYQLQQTHTHQQQFWLQALLFWGMRSADNATQSAPSNTKLSLQQLHTKIQHKHQNRYCIGKSKCVRQLRCMTTQQLLVLASNLVCFCLSQH